MSESSTPPPGINPEFNLGEHIAANQPQPGEFENEVVAAARRQFEDNVIDPKSGLLKQGPLEAMLDKRLGQIKPGDNLTVFVADLDGFKLVNDELGHDPGDEVLAIAGEAFIKTFRRSTDVAAHGDMPATDSQFGDSTTGMARLGGDEFVAYAYSTPRERQKNNRESDPDAAAKLQIERLNEEFKKLLEGTKFERFAGLRLSVGFAQYEKNDITRTIFKRADMAMLEEKYRGKIENITERDKKRLRGDIAFMESKGARVEAWLKRAVEEPTAA